MQDIGGLVLVAPAITAFASDLKAQANGTDRYAQHCLVVLNEYLFELGMCSAPGVHARAYLGWAEFIVCLL